MCWMPFLHVALLPKPQRWQWCSMRLTAVWALCMVPHRPESTSVTCNPVQSRVFLPQGASVHPSFTCCRVCMQSRSYTFSVCKIVVCVWVCVRVWTHVCVLMCVHTRAHTCVCTCGARGGLCVSLTLSHTPFLIPLRQGLSLTLQLGWQPAGPSKAVSTSPHAAVPDFLCGCWDLNLSPPNCKASALLTEPSSWTLFDTFSKVFWLFVFVHAHLQRWDV